MSTEPQVSVVIPIYNEEENLPDLVERVGEALARSRRSFELICVDDGSRDASAQTMAELAADPSLVQAAVPDPQLRSVGGAAGRVRRRARRVHRDARRRPAERSRRRAGAAAAHGRASGRGHDLGLAQGPPGPHRLAQDPVGDRQRHHLAGDRRAAARLRLRAQGLPRPGDRRSALVRRAASLHPRARRGRRREGPRGAGAASSAHARQVQVRHRPHRARGARSAVDQVPDALPAPADARVRRRGRGAGTGRRLDPRLARLRQAGARPVDRRTSAAAARRAARADRRAAGRHRRARRAADPHLPRAAGARPVRAALRAPRCAGGPLPAMPRRRASV